MSGPTILVPKKCWSLGDILKMFEAKGWKPGRAKGAFVAGDLVELGQAIILCDTCKHGFDWKKHHYYSVSKYDQVKATGRCDLCREQSQHMNLYLHDTVVGESGSWIPRTTLRELRRKAIRPGSQRRI